MGPDFYGSANDSAVSPWLRIVPVSTVDDSAVSPWLRIVPVSTVDDSVLSLDDSALSL